VTNGGTGVTTSTGSGANVLSTSPTLTTPVLGAATGTSLSLSSTSTSSSAVTGALQVAGGIGVGGASYFGGAVTAASTLNVGANIEMPASSSIRFNSGTGLIYTGGYSYALSLQSSQLNLNTLSNSPINTGTGLATFGGAATFAGAVSVSGTAATFTSGTGSPESVKTAPVGSLYTRTDGGASTTLYVKESGAGNTGWIAK
jgi:hypothetical protein